MWSQYAMPGWQVDLFWVRDPRSPEPHAEMIAEDVPVLTHEGSTTHDGEPAEIITVDVTAEQAERLKRLPKVGWLRALPRSMPSVRGR